MLATWALKTMGNLGNSTWNLKTTGTLVNIGTLIAIGTLKTIGNWSSSYSITLELNYYGKIGKFRQSPGERKKRLLEICFAI